MSRNKLVATTALFARIVSTIALLIFVSAGTSYPMGKIALSTKETFQKTVPVGFYTRVNVTNQDGNIIVTGVPGATSISVTANKRVWGTTPGKAREAMAGLTIAVRPQGDLLRIRPEHGAAWDNTYEVEFVVYVPGNFRVEAQSAVGNVQIRAVREADAKTGDGSAVMTNIGNVTAKTGDGDVAVDSTSGPVEITTAGGNVRARISGALQAIRIATTGGGVKLQLPRQLSCELSVTTAGGLVTAQGLTLQDAEQSLYGVRGTVGEGGIPVEITSETGAVTVSTRQIVMLTARDFLRPSTPLGQRTRPPSGGPIPPPVAPVMQPEVLDVPDIPEVPEMPADMPEVPEMPDEADATAEPEPAADMPEATEPTAGDEEAASDPAAAESAGDDAEAPGDEAAQPDAEPEAEPAEEAPAEPEAGAAEEAPAETPADE